MNLGAVMAITSHYRQTSPVLRGAWVLETLLGTPVPPPPPNVPRARARRSARRTARRTPRRRSACGRRSCDHRVNPACSACHNLMDPIGFALENFDWTGRWRDKEFDGSAIDATRSAAVGREVRRPCGAAPGAAGPERGFPAAPHREAARLRARTQPAGWRQLHRAAARRQPAEETTTARER